MLVCQLLLAVALTAQAPPGHDEARGLVRQAAAAHANGQDADAQRELRRALRLQPDLTIASILLGQILYSQADLQGAIAVYADALTHAPDDARLTTTLAAWRHEAETQQSFSSRAATHFTILFEGAPDQPLAARASDMLESIYWQVGSALGAYPNDLITVVLYSKEQFRDITRAPAWAGGEYDGRIRLPIAGAIDDKELRRVLTHEFTHAVVHSLAPRGVPQWLNEGLAMLMERGGVAPAIPSDAVVAPLAKLEGSFEGLDPAEARAAYLTSAAATQALLDRAGPNVIYNLLTNLGNGMDFDTAFERAAMMSYREFRASWRSAS